jgi:8-oxo-dGTP diphosphatase
MQKEFSTMVILDESNEHTMLILHKDFRIWALPDGGLETGETPEDVAIREAYEETGYEVKIDRYIGSYHRPQFHDIRHVFRGRIIGGRSLESGLETAAVNWYPIRQLPKRLAPSVPEIVLDSVLDCEKPLEKIQNITSWKVICIRIMVKIRNLFIRISE